MQFSRSEKLSSVAACGAFCVLLAATTASAQVTLDIGNATASSGGSAEVLVELQDSGGDIAVVVFFLEFDAALATVTTVEPGPDAPAGFVAQFMPNPNGSVGVTIFGPGNIALPDGDILSLSFNVSALPEGTVIPITGFDSSVATVDDPPDEPPSVVRPGAITISAVMPPPTCGSKVVEPKALPEIDPATGLRHVPLDAPVYVRLEHLAGIDPDSVWADVTTPSGTEATVALKPLVSTDYTNVWAVIAPDSSWTEGDWITVSAGATGRDAVEVGPVIATFFASGNGDASAPGSPNRTAQIASGDALLYTLLILGLFAGAAARGRFRGRIG